jgi:hypothetical protein
MQSVGNPRFLSAMFAEQMLTCFVCLGQSSTMRDNTAAC